MGIPLIACARAHARRVALRVSEDTFTYRDLLEASAAVASSLIEEAGDLREARVAYFVPPGFDHVAVQWGIWRAGGIAVPLALAHPPPEWEHVIRDSGASRLLTPRSLATPLRQLAANQGLRCLAVEDALRARPATALPDVQPQRRALILYTSGSTGRPKGVVATHASIRSQIVRLVDAWEWSSADRIPLVLPLHHVHGLINVVGCALWSGACCDIWPRFEARDAWKRMVDTPLTLFMAVPTIYSRLLSAWEAESASQRRVMSEACARLRLMVSGSAALPVQLLEAWQQISGQVLLERYGMTEIGMALSNPLRGQRRAGCVGTPLPGIELRLVDEAGNEPPPGTPGEIRVRGDGVFREYWGQPEATREAFRDGWFCTGDVAVVDRGSIRILGRQSVDIIKTGGYKVSALEIEEVLRGHPSVADCAVVGIPDPVWGERVGAAVVLRPGAQLDLQGLRAWAGRRLATYKVPSRLAVLEALPRNALGKVVKPELGACFRP